MLELIKRNYWWSEIKDDIKKYVQGCTKCQQNKIQYLTKAGKHYPLETPEGPWQEISINIIGPLPRWNSKDAIVVIVDQFTKIIRLKVTNITVLSEDIAKIYQDEIWKLYGVPWKVLSDKGPQYVSKLMENLTKVLKTKRTLSMVYYSQPDSQIEQIN